MKLFIALMSLTLVFPNISCTEKKTNHLGEILFFAGINASTQKRSGGNIAATSSDGITWTNQSLPSSQIWSSVAYGNGTYVAVTGFKIPMATTSPGGITWTSRTLPSSQNWTSIAYGNGVFVAITSGIFTRDTTAPNNVSATSPDGITWTSRTLSSPQNWTSLVYGNNIFVAVSGYIYYY